MAESVMELINTIICLFRYDGSIHREDPVVISEKLGTHLSLHGSEGKDGENTLRISRKKIAHPSTHASEKKDAEPLHITQEKIAHPSMQVIHEKDGHVTKCPVIILDPRRKNFIGSVDLSKRKTFTPQVKEASKDTSDEHFKEGQGILVFTLWYIFIAWAYFRGSLGKDEKSQAEPGLDEADDYLEVTDDIAEETDDILEVKVKDAKNVNADVTNNICNVAELAKNITKMKYDTVEAKNDNADVTDDIRDVAELADNIAQVGNEIEETLAPEPKVEPETEPDPVAAPDPDVETPAEEPAEE